MTEWYVLSGLGLLAILTIGVSIYPLRRNRLLVWIVPPLAVLFMLVAYSAWGDFFGLQTHLLKQRKSQEVQSILKSPKRTAALIKTMIQHIDETPKSAQAWYLVGKLYLSQKEYQQACDAFALAYKLNSDDSQIGVFYAQSLWSLNHQQFNALSRQVLHHVLKINPNQPDALAMLAIDAYTEHHKEQAIIYWERLLALMPPESAEVRAIQEAIVKAKRESP